MGTEFLVASLWGVVLVYWFWSRRPTTADTVGLFRRELQVLEGATPTRVPPANRRRTTETAPVPSPVAAAARCHKRMELRRRRKDVISALLVAVVVSAAAAVLLRSEIAVGSQLACDLALFSYAYLLVRAARARTGADVGGGRPLSLTAALAPAVPRADPVVWHEPTAQAPVWAHSTTAVPAVALSAAERAGAADGEWQPKRVPASRPRPTERPLTVPLASARPDRVRPAGVRPERVRPATARYVPVHAVARAVQRAVSNEGAECYGDFDSYASLALASAP
jgi:hypothetical protein